ncbi:hypothetical protein MOUN0_N02542 [Monosporozyma unispora]|nr:hypothetical protein C6P44_001696 [Kazachstania unispora]
MSSVPIIFNTPGIPSLSVLDSCESRELLWRLSFKFEGKAAAALRAFLRSHKTLRTITNKNRKVWTFWDLELGEGSIPIVVLKRLVDKMDYGFETAFKDLFCKVQEDKVNDMCLDSWKGFGSMVEQINSRFDMLATKPPSYISLESDIIVIKGIKPFHTTLIQWSTLSRTKRLYVADIEQGTFTRDNLGYPSMKHSTISYGIRGSLINTCTPYVSTKNTKNPFNKNDYPLYAGNVGSLIHFYDSILNQIFEILSPLCQFEREVIPKTSFRHMSPEYFDLLEREFDIYIHPMKGKIPKVLKRLLLLQKKINTSADLFYLYHKHISVDLPEYFEGFWKSKLDVLSVFSNYGEEFMSLFDEIKTLGKEQLDIYLDRKDLVLARIIVKLLFTLKEFLDELSFNDLRPFLVFFYVPRLLNLKSIVQSFIKETTDNKLEINLKPIIKRINNQLLFTAIDCKTVFVAGAMHISKGKDVIECYEQMTGEPFSLEKELKNLSITLYNKDELFRQLKLSASPVFPNIPSFVENTLEEYMHMMAKFIYEMWEKGCNRPLYIDGKNKNMFLKKNVGFRGSYINDVFKYIYFRSGNDSKNSFVPTMTPTETLSCDNKMTFLYLLEIPSLKVNNAIPSRHLPNVLAAIINYLSCVDVNSTAKMAHILKSKSTTYDKISRIKQLCRLQLSMVTNGEFNQESMGIAFLSSLQNSYL